MKKVLVTGANGQLGKSIHAIASTFPELNFVYKNSSELDVTRVEDVKEDFLKGNYDWCINCAAYTSVDKAEIEKDKAYSVNVLGVKNIANSCKDNFVKLIHISTDFVFDGEQQIPYSEGDLPNPKTTYGLTKLQGELEIHKILKESIIIRTSWLYSEFGNNFMKTMLSLAKKRNELNIVNDQIGTPTYAVDLAKVIVGFIEKEELSYGLYHFSNKGSTSWYGFAKAIFELSRISIKITSITTESYPTTAIRPKYSVLEKTKIEETMSLKNSNWKDSLIKALNRL